MNKERRTVCYEKHCFDPETKFGLEHLSLFVGKYEKFAPL